MFNSFSGSIPTGLGLLTNLISLDLSWNQLTGSLPSELGNLSSAANIVLSSNSITGRIPPEIAGIRGLETIEVVATGINEVPPEICGNVDTRVIVDKAKAGELQTCSCCEAWMKGESPRYWTEDGKITFI